ncbi:MAG: hypothetical protein P4L16_04805 [Chlamydiales bacterium]|nr:hypothetical protein [Chlamydiales bacterium]
MLDGKISEAIFKYSIIQKSESRWYQSPIKHLLLMIFQRFVSSEIIERNFSSLSSKNISRLTDKQIQQLSPQTFGNIQGTARSALINRIHIISKDIFNPEQKMAISSLERLTNITVDEIRIFSPEDTCTFIQDYISKNPEKTLSKPLEEAFYRASSKFHTLPQTIRMNMLERFAVSATSDEVVLFTKEQKLLLLQAYATIASKRVIKQLNEFIRNLFFVDDRSFLQFNAKEACSFIESYGFMLKHNPQLFTEDDWVRLNRVLPKALPELETLQNKEILLQLCSRFPEERSAQPSEHVIVPDRLSVLKSTPLEAISKFSPKEAFKFIKDYIDDSREPLSKKDWEKLEPVYSMTLTSLKLARRSRLAMIKAFQRDPVSDFPWIQILQSTTLEDVKKFTPQEAYAFVAAYASVQMSGWEPGTKTSVKHPMSDDNWKVFTAAHRKSAT